MAPRVNGQRHRDELLDKGVWILGRGPLVFRYHTSEAVPPASGGIAAHRATMRPATDV